MPTNLYRGIRTIITYEDVEVYADSYSEAVELIEDDDETVKITGERDGDYKVSGHLTEITE